MDHSQASSEQAPASLLRQIPAVDELLNRASLRALEQRVGRRHLVDATRQVLQDVRGRIASGGRARLPIGLREREIRAATQATQQRALQPATTARARTSD